jgi:hypothetical protein
MLAVLVVRLVLPDMMSILESTTAMDKKLSVFRGRQGTGSANTECLTITIPTAQLGEISIWSKHEVCAELALVSFTLFFVYSEQDASTGGHVSSGMFQC